MVCSIEQAYTGTVLDDIDAGAVVLYRESTIKVLTSMVL
jgi:hypothetical protein